MILCQLAKEFPSFQKKNCIGRQKIVDFLNCPFLQPMRHLIFNGFMTFCEVFLLPDNKQNYHSFVRWDPFLQLKKKGTPILASTETPLKFFPRGDDNFGSVAINFNFNYFGTYFSQLNIHTNAYVYFDRKSNISALNYDLSTTYGGGIYCQNLNSQSPDFNSIKSDLNRLNSNFVPTNIFRITYDIVPGWYRDGNFVSGGSPGSLRASFQIVLAS